MYIFTQGNFYNHLAINKGRIIYMATGQLIRELRLKKGMTQEELAEKAYTSVRTIQRIENGTVEPRAHTLQAIASALEMDYEEFMNPDKATSGDGDLNTNSIWLPLLHLSGLFILLFPPLIIWTWKKEQIENMREHGIDVINFQLTMLILLVPAGLLAGFLITIPVIILLGVFSTIIIIVNTMKVMNAQPYYYPLKMKILKP